MKIIKSRVGAKLALKELFKSLSSSHPLAKQFFIRDIRGQYRNSFLGYLWAFIPPVITAIGLGMAKNSKVINIQETEIPYEAYVIISMSLWTLFTDSFNAPSGVINSNMKLLSKISFNKEALFLSKVYELLTNFSIKLVLIALVFIFFQLPLTIKAFFIPFGIFSIIVSGFSLGLLITPFKLLFSDLTRAITLGVGAWIFITPILYPLPEGDSLFGTIVRLNPITYVILTARDFFIGGEVKFLENFLLLTIIFSILLILGLVIFRMVIGYIVERMEN